MPLKSLLFALLLSGTASVPPPLPVPAKPCPLIYRPVCCGGVTYANACVAGERQCDDGACSTPARSGGYDGHEDQDEPAARAAVSNHSTRIKNPCRSRRVSSDEQQNPDPDSNDARVPSPQAGLVKMPQAVHAVWPILLLWSPHGARMLQVE